MEKIPKEKLVDEMFEMTQYQANMIEKNAKRLMANLPIILSLATIFILLVLYSFNNGYYRVYNIPTSWITVDLQDFLPVALQFCGIYMFLVFYITQIKKDKILQINRPNLLRIFYGELILYFLLINSNIDNLIGRVATFIISLVLPIITELFYWLMKKPRKKKKYTVSEKKIVLNGMIEDRMLYLINSKYLFGIIVTVVLFASIWGNLCAKAENEYQIFAQGDVIYAVIIDQRDKVIAERITKENGTLIIDTTSYTYVPKDNVIFSAVKFDKVIIE